MDSNNNMKGDGYMNNVNKFITLLQTPYDKYLTKYQK